MAGYSKEMLVDALVSRYASVFNDVGHKRRYADMVSRFYDEVGRDKFRIWASLDPKAIKEYKAAKI